MVWVKVNRLELSNNDSENQIAYFNYLGREKYSIISKSVLNWLKTPQINIGDYIYVLKSFRYGDKPTFLIKKYKNKQKGDNLVL